MKNISTLVEDIYHILDENTDHECNEEFLEIAAQAFKETMRRRLAKQERKGTLRFSNLGRPDCQTWWKVNHPDEAEPLSPQTQMKFLYGDVLEILALYLSREAGHEVTHEQHEVSCDGVLGHIDAIIDDVVVDVKSASPYAFRKFEENRVEDDDPFGYIAQLSGYANALDKDRAGFFAINKESGGLCFSPLSPQLIKENPPEQAIKRQRDVLSVSNPPFRYDAVPDGKSGNLKLATVCSYCDHKFNCWADANDGQGLRTFIYAQGPRFLTDVKRAPDVYEVVR